MGAPGRTASAAPKARPIRPNGHAAGFLGSHPRWGEPYSLHTYRDLTGAPLFFVAYYRDVEGGWQSCPWTYHQGAGWLSDAWPAPRPLYGQELLMPLAGSKVLIFTDERQADAARRLSTLTICMAIAGEPAHCDLDALAGREVAIWPANNRDGRLRAAAIIERATSSDCSLIDTSTLAPDADFIEFSQTHTKDEISAFIREHKKPAPATREPTELGERLLSLEQPDGASEGDDRPGGLVEGGARALPQFVGDTDCWDYFGLTLGSGGRPWPNSANLMRVFELHPQFQGSLWFDAFRMRLMLNARQWSDERDGGDLLVMLQKDIHINNLNAITVHQSVRTFAHRFERHPVREWLSALPAWDQTERLKTLMSDAYGTPQDEYYAAVGKNFLIGAVARVMNPGCQLDNMPVFEGAQGIRKTSALRVLAGPWYSAIKANMREKDFMQGLQGFWIIEIEELDAIYGATLERTKAMISGREDDFRWSHARDVVTYQRQCVFAGTTNSSSWNHDETGARRFWPVACVSINLDYLNSEREQLFAEAFSAFQRGEPWHIVPEARAAAEVEARFVADPWEERLAWWLTAREEVSIAQALEALEVPIERQGKADSNRVGRILRHLQWFSVAKWIDGRTVKVFRHRGKGKLDS